MAKASWHFTPLSLISDHWSLTSCVGSWLHSSFFSYFVFTLKFHLLFCILHSAINFCLYGSFIHKNRSLVVLCVLSLCVNWHWLQSFDCKSTQKAAFNKKKHVVHTMPIPFAGKKSERLLWSVILLTTL